MCQPLVLAAEENLQTKSCRAHNPNGGPSDCRGGGLCLLTWGEGFIFSTSWDFLQSLVPCVLLRTRGLPYKPSLLVENWPWDLLARKCLAWFIRAALN